MENIKTVHMIKEMFHLTVYYFNISCIHSTIMSYLIPACSFEISLSGFVIFSIYFSFFMSADKYWKSKIPVR